MLRRLLAVLLVALLALPAAARPAATVSAADPRAAAAGIEILKAGGSAADAAIAMMLALNVVEPQSSGIGGGGFMVHARGRRVTSFDGREEAPMAADPHWFYAGGQPLSKRDAVPGGRSVGVPGNLRMMALAHRAHGRLPWARLFAPAIRLARDGFAITPRLASIIRNNSANVDPWARTYLLQADGTPKPVGTVLRNPEQAGLFERIAAHGPDSFYVGPTAQALVATVDGAARNPSKMAIGDLAAYAAQARDPICGTYRVYRICGMGPPLLRRRRGARDPEAAGAVRHGGARPRVAGRVAPVRRILAPRLRRSRHVSRRRRSRGGAGRGPHRSRLSGRPFGPDLTRP